MIKGSCLCGEIQFEIHGDGIQINLCHCKMCQKLSGSAFGSFMRVKAEDYHLVRGASFERVYDSSEWAARAFCSQCGSSTQYIHKESNEYKFVAAGCLDTDPAIKGHHHIFVDDKACWYEINSSIPQFPDWRSSVSNNV